MMRMVAQVAFWLGVICFVVALYSGLKDSELLFAGWRGWGAGGAALMLTSIGASLLGRGEGK